MAYDTTLNIYTLYFSSILEHGVSKLGNCRDTYLAACVGDANIAVGLAHHGGGMEWPGHWPRGPWGGPTGQCPIFGPVASE